MSDFDNRADRAGFYSVPPGSSKDLLDTFEGTWHAVDVHAVEAGAQMSLDATDRQFLVFVMEGVGSVTFDGRAIAIGQGSAFGVPEGTTLEVHAESDLVVAAVVLAAH